MANYRNDYYERDYDSGYNRNRNGNRRRRGRRRGARNGAKKGVFTQGNYKGEMFVRGWRVENRALVTIMARPFKGTKSGETKSGRKWENWMCIIEDKRTGVETISSGFYYPDDHSFHCEEKNWMILPAKNYCGHYSNHPNSRRRRNRY